MTVYMMITKDKYEFPLALADSVAELAKMIGREEITIRSALSHAKNQKKCKYIKVEIEEGENDE